jgi:hypothetical protein
VNYAERVGAATFRDFLFKLGEDHLSEFFDVCDSADQISAYRPFYPNRSKKGCLPQHLFDAHGVTSMEALLRECERGSDGHRQACSLFWTLGGNQVGKAALCGWKEVLIPALRDDAVGLWPFNGRLESLLTEKRVIIAETYPAECYGWFSGSMPRSKGDINSRKEFGSSLLSWASENVVVERRLETAIKNGFPTGRDDAFDAVVGLFGMLKVVLGKHVLEEPDVTPIRQVEGWILGRKASLVHGEQIGTLFHRWSEWRQFPDPRKGEVLVAPFGPGCYDLRNRQSSESILCGMGDHLAQRMSSLLPQPYGCGTRDNAAKRDYVLANLGDVVYRTTATATKTESLDIERQLLCNERYLFPT